MLSEREKLEEELRFLKESFDIGVITEGEFETGKERIEKRLEHFGVMEGRNQDLEEEIGVKEAEEISDVKIEDKKESQLTLEGKQAEEKESLDDIHETEEENEFLEPKEKLEEKENKQEELVKNPKEETKEDELINIDLGEEKSKENKEDLFETISEKKHGKEPTDDAEIKINKKLLIFSLIIAVLAVGTWYFFYGGSNDNALEVDNAAEVEKVMALIACHSDKDCKQDGKIGMCSNPGTKNSECSYLDDVEVKLTILATNECFNCDTGRVLSIVKSFYPNLEIKSVNIDTEEGKGIAEQFKLNALPAYILNGSLVDTQNYDKFSNAFSEINGNFLMKNTVSNANYYVNRQEIERKLDLIVQDGKEASIQAEENLKEFLDAFEGKVNFEKHGSSSTLAKQLGVNSFPVFFVNNKNKFSGVQAAETIKENFCQLNDLQECSLELSKNLI